MGKKKQNFVVDNEQLNNPDSMINSNNPYVSASALETLGVKPSNAKSKEVIGKAQIDKAYETFQKYRSCKQNLDARIIANERWYKLRHWEQIRDKGSENDPEPTSAWLFNCIASKHADAMDSFPCANILPREKDDVTLSKALTDIVPVVLKQNDFESTYDRCWWYKLKQGCAFYGVFWNPDKLNGLGDIDIKKCDILNLAWAPGIADIQESPNLFHAILVDNEILENRYEQLKGKLQGNGGVRVSEYVHDDTIPTEDKSLVIDWYYKKNGILHYCKFVNDTVLFATENDDEYAERGWYEHGLYPFVPDVCFPEEDTPVGFGYIDICKDPQAYIDILGQAILKNAIVCSTPRYLVRGDESGINENEFLDLTKPFVHCDAGLGNEQIRPIEVNGISGNYLNYFEMKIDEMKETSGNRDVSNGGTSGATAASAIAAMQEAGSKLSRDMNKASYRAYEAIIYQVIELIRQFYDLPRTFRLTGNKQGEMFIQFSNSQMKSVSMGEAFGEDAGYRTPYFDIEISAEKNSPYLKASNNELALQLYQSGFFAPENADAALACLQFMDFDKREDVIEKVEENATLLKQVQQLQSQIQQLSAVVDAQNGTNFTAVAGGQPMAQTDIPNGNRVGKSASGGVTAGESSITENARRRVAENSAPR